MNHILFLDVAPDPESMGIGVAGFVLIGIVVLMLVVAALAGFVFLMKRIRKTADGADTRLVVGDVCLNLANVAPQSDPSADSNR